MSNNVAGDLRFRELHRRMTEVGGGPNAFSASEMHELSEYIDELLAGSDVPESVVGNALDARTVLLGLAEEHEAKPVGERTKLDRLRSSVLRATADVLIRHDSVRGMIKEKREAFSSHYDCRHGIATCSVKQAQPALRLLEDFEATLFGEAGAQFITDLGALLLQGVDACIDIVKRRRAYYEAYEKTGVMQTRSATFVVIDELLTLLEAHRERAAQRGTTAL